MAALFLKVTTQAYSKHFGAWTEVGKEVQVDGILTSGCPEAPMGAVPIWLCRHIIWGLHEAP